MIPIKVAVITQGINAAAAAGHVQGNNHKAYITTAVTTKKNKNSNQIFHKRFICHINT